MHFFRVLILAGMVCQPLAAEAPDHGRAPVEPKSLPAPDQVMAEVQPSIVRIDTTRYRIREGEDKAVEFDSRTREIGFPAVVNMDVGLLEFAIVHVNGKVHESLFFTEVSPTDLNIAFKLLRYQPSRELYFLPDEHGGLSGALPDVPEEIRQAARVVIDVEWTDEDGKQRRHPINRWILNERFSGPMPDGPWVYGGSEFYAGRFVPEMTGDIAAIDISNSSLINYPGEDNMDDTVWVVRQGIVPPAGTKVRLIVAPYKTDAESPAVEIPKADSQDEPKTPES